MAQSNFSHSVPHKEKIIIGVLSLQGCVKPHRFHIESLGACFKEIKTAQDLENIHGIILPGGESTTMLKLIEVFGLEESLRSAFARIPVWGICAGAILMANKVSSPAQSSFGLLDIEIQRNAYGNQLNSFNAIIENSPVSFIRAPRITQVAENITIKAVFNQIPVWVENKFYMATTFHPELSTQGPSALHTHFLNLVLQNLSLSITV